MIFLLCPAPNKDLCKNGLKEELNRLEKWFLANELILKTRKKNLMVLRIRNQDGMKITDQNRDIKSVEVIYFLRLKIDKNLIYKPQIDNIIDTLSRLIMVWSFERHYR